MNAAEADGNWLTEDVQTYNSSSIGNPYMFTGRRWDHMTGIYYYRFRDYDPKLGRFLQSDPAGYIDTMNLYAYCGNNPVNWIDPWGLCEKGPGIAEAGVAVGAGFVLVGGMAISTATAEMGATGIAVVLGGGVGLVAAGGAIAVVAVLVDAALPEADSPPFPTELGPLQELNEEWRYYEKHPDEYYDYLIGY